MAETMKGTLKDPGKTMKRALKFAAKGKGARPALAYVHKCRIAPRRCFRMPR